MDRYGLVVFLQINRSGTVFGPCSLGITVIHGQSMMTPLELEALDNHLWRVEETAARVKGQSKILCPSETWWNMADL